MYSRLLRYPKGKSFFLFGPRGTGKSSWVHTQFPNAITIDLLASERYNDLLANPGRLEDFIPNAWHDWVIIDEVQKIPELLNEVHRLIEKARTRFVLTGSSARKLRAKGVNLLAGRAHTLSMYPLTVQVLGNDFDLAHSLTYGQLPCVYTEKDAKGYLEAYVKTYLKEEVQQEGLTRNLGAFSRFLEAASFSQGSLLNISEVARECAVERKVVENYFTILEDLLLGVRLPVFTKRAKREMVAHPKFYFFDVGVYRTVRPTGPLDRPEEIEGAACETLFFQELRAMNDYLKLGYHLYYWRTITGHEVDFVLYGPRGLRAFEIKRARKPPSKAIKSLQAFLEDFPMAQAYLIYGGEVQQKAGKINILPMVESLKKLPTYL